MRQFKDGLVCLVLFSVFAAIMEAVSLIHDADAVVLAVNRAVVDAPVQIAAQGERTRREVLDIVRDSVVRLDRQVGGLRSDVRVLGSQVVDVADGRLSSIERSTAAQLSDAIQRADAQLGRANDSVSQVAALSEALKPTIEHVNEASGILLRRDAMPAQLLGLTAAAKVTLGETAQTMRDVRGAVPGFLAQGQGIAANFQAVTGNINRLTKPHWYDRLLGYGLNGAMLYRNLNPATNLTIKGAQFVASRP